jgi:hypothetical protein
VLQIAKFKLLIEIALGCLPSLFRRRVNVGIVGEEAESSLGLYQGQPLSFEGFACQKGSHF